MKWKIPPKIKIYEALGAIGDKRIELTGNQAEVFSSSRKKFYIVNYREYDNAIMCNDNGSYWQGYLGYPSIAFLMLKGKVIFDKKFADALKDIAWKDINTLFKSDYEKTEQHILQLIEQRGFNKQELLEEVDKIYEQVKKLDLNLLGARKKPPKGY